MTVSPATSRGVVFPFTAVVGQDDLKLALSLLVVDPHLGGLLAFGDRGTGKSTTVRALAKLLPKMRAFAGCAYQCDPSSPFSNLCETCSTSSSSPMKDENRIVDVPVPVVELPLGATEDRLVGALDLEIALTRGERRFSPGLLARAHRGFLYIDEVNLLPDHLVDLLLDVAASGENIVERDGVSIRHPARFVLIGSGNPEEGELRPQLLDRFGLSVDVKTPSDIASRVEVVKRRLAFEERPDAFVESRLGEERVLSGRLAKARAHVGDVTIPEPVLQRAATLCQSLGTDGLRGELTLIRAARAVASLDGDREVQNEHLRRVASMALRHRLRQRPLDDAGNAGVRVDKAVAEVLP